MDATLAGGLDECLSLHAARATIRLPSLFSELIMELPASIAEPLLVRHWSSISRTECFVQAAIFVDSVETRRLAGEALSEFGERERLLRHILMNFGMREVGRSERFSLAQAEGLEPYLDDLGDRALSSLWQECNRRGWIAWRREHLDRRVARLKDRPINCDAASRTRLLDALVGKVVYWPDVFEHDFTGIGYSREEAFEIFAEWARAKGSEEALIVAGRFFRAEATRALLPLFDQLLTESRDDPSLRDDIRFSVMRRTLS
jgi:hypothetical protein